MDLDRRRARPSEEYGTVRRRVGPGTRLKYLPFPALTGNLLVMILGCGHDVSDLARLGTYVDLMAASAEMHHTRLILETRTRFAA